VDFYSAYAQGFARIAAVTLPVHLADPVANAAAVIEQARACHDDSVAVAVYPELCLTGYSVDDLFLQDTLLATVEEAIAEIVAASADLMTMLVIGAPVVHGDRVFNAAVVVHRGSILGVAPKSYLPNYREFYERRWFAPGDDRELEWISVAGQDVRFGPDLIFRCLDVPGLDLHVEVCEDMWVPVPPSAEAALAGATVLANLSGSPITIARAEDRRLLVRSASARCSAAYVYAAAGQGESTTDLSWDGQTMVYECGSLLGESERFPDGPRRTVVDVDLDLVRQERMRQVTFDDNRRTLARCALDVWIEPARPAAGARVAPLPPRARFPHAHARTAGASRACGGRLDSRAVAPAAAALARTATGAGTAGPSLRPDARAVARPVESSSRHLS